jgi:hypothetical protein
MDGGVGRLPLKIVHVLSVVYFALAWEQLSPSKHPSLRAQ